MYYKGHGEVKVDILLLLTANNCWTRSFALGYWLLYFSSVLDSDEERKPLQVKDFSSEYVCCLFTLALIGDRQFRQSVNILCWTISWIKHSEAHVISHCLVFCFWECFTFWGVQIMLFGESLWTAMIVQYHVGCISCYGKICKICSTGWSITIQYFPDCVVFQRH